MMNRKMKPEDIADLEGVIEVAEELNRRLKELRGEYRNNNNLQLAYKHVRGCQLSLNKIYENETKRKK